MKHSRVSRAASALMVAMVVSIWLAPAANAQLIDGGGGITGDIGGAIGGGGSGASDSGGGLVGGITDELEGGSNNAGSDGDPAGGDSTGVVGGVVDKIDETVDNSQDQVDQTTGGATGTVTETVGGVGSTVGGTVGGATGTVDKVTGDLTGNGGKKDRRSDRQDAKTSASASGVTGDDILGRSLADALRVDGKGIAVARADGREFSGVAMSASAPQSVVAQIAKVAAAAVEQVAFPMALTLLVIGFLMVQNRIDNKDPKLALAPVDSEHDLLSFT